MRIDRQILRETLANYQAWNEDKTLSQILQDRARTPEEKWLAYQDLYSFAMRVQRGINVWAEILTTEEWTIYYSQMHQFETRRRQRGKTA